MELDPFPQKKRLPGHARLVSRDWCSDTLSISVNILLINTGIITDISIPKKPYIKGKYWMIYHIAVFLRGKCFAFRWSFRFRG